MLQFGLWSVGFASAETQTTADERNCMARYATGKKLLAEIGVYQGVTTCRLKAAMDPAGLLVAIDPYPTGRLGFSAAERIAKREVAKVPGGRISWLRTTGIQAAAQFAQNGGAAFDFVFIDGDHTYEGLRDDWESWSPLIGARGIVALHDSRSSPLRQIEGVGSVVFTQQVVLKDSRFRTSETIDSLTVLERC